MVRLLEMGFPQTLFLQKLLKHPLTQSSIWNIQLAPIKRQHHVADIVLSFVLLSHQSYFNLAARCLNFQGLVVHNCFTHAFAYQVANHDLIPMLQNSSTGHTIPKVALVGMSIQLSHVARKLLQTCQEITLTHLNQSLKQLPFHAELIRRLLQKKLVVPLLEKLFDLLRVISLARKQNLFYCLLVVVQENMLANIVRLNERVRPEPLQAKVVDEAVLLQRLHILRNVPIFAESQFLGQPQHNGESVPIEVSQLQPFIHVLEVMQEDAIIPTFALLDFFELSFGYSLQGGPLSRDSALILGACKLKMLMRQSELLRNCNSRVDRVQVTLHEQELDVLLRILLQLVGGKELLEVNLAGPHENMVDRAGNLFLKFLIFLFFLCWGLLVALVLRKALKKRDVLSNELMQLEALVLVLRHGYFDFERSLLSGLLNLSNIICNLLRCLFSEMLLARLYEIKRQSKRIERVSFGLFLGLALPPLLAYHFFPPLSILDDGDALLLIDFIHQEVCEPVFEERAELDTFAEVSRNADPSLSIVNHSFEQIYNSIDFFVFKEISKTSLDLVRLSILAIKSWTPVLMFSAICATSI